MTAKQAYQIKSRNARRGNKFSAIEKSINRNISKIHKPVAALVVKLRKQVRREVEAVLMKQRNAVDSLMAM